MTCPDCLHAREHPRSVRFTAGCEGCAARALSRDPRFFTAARQGKFTPDYLGALAQFFPKLSQADAHAMVKAWVQPRAEAAATVG